MPTAAAPVLREKTLTSASAFIGSVERRVQQRHDTFIGTPADQHQVADAVQKSGRSFQRNQRTQLWQTSAA
jgi:hypothetical protein